MQARVAKIIFLLVFPVKIIRGYPNILWGLFPAREFAENSIRFVRYIILFELTLPPQGFPYSKYSPAVSGSIYPILVSRCSLGVLATEWHEPLGYVRHAVQWVSSWAFASRYSDTLQNSPEIRISSFTFLSFYSSLQSWICQGQERTNWIFF